MCRRFHQQLTKSIVIAVSLVTLAACGVKHGNVEPPSGSEIQTFRVLTQTPQQRAKSRGIKVNDWF